MIVTALRERPRGRVEIDLDGVRWRVVPAAAVVRASLAVGRPLDREAARALGRELRRAEALDVAFDALRHRDLSRQALDERLSRRGAGPAARADALETLARVGLVDDARVAATRGQALAERGYGDEAIRLRLEHDGLDGELVAAALEGLAPEAERARELLELRGRTAKTVRWLAGRGFDPSLLEDVLPVADGTRPR